MGYLVGMGVTLFIGVILYFTAQHFQKVYAGKHERNEYPPDADDISGIWKWIKRGTLIVVILLVGLVTITRSYNQVESGHVKVVYTFGAIDGQIGEGVNWIAPWSSARDETIQVQKKVYEDLTSASKETQDVKADVSLNIKVDPKDVEFLYRQVGPDWYDRLVPQRVLQSFKDTTVQFNAVELLPNREQLKQTVKGKLQSSLSAYSIEVVDVNITDIEFSPGFTKSIEDKQIATQEKLRQQELVEVERQKGEAIKAKAQGEADANRLISESLKEDPRLLEFRIAELQANAVIALAKEGTVQMIPSELLLTRPVTP